MWKSFQSGGGRLVEGREPNSMRVALPPEPLVPTASSDRQSCAFFHFSCSSIMSFTACSGTTIVSQFFKGDVIVQEEGKARLWLLDSDVSTHSSMTFRLTSPACTVGLWPSAPGLPRGLMSLNTHRAQGGIRGWCSLGCWTLLPSLFLSSGTVRNARVLFGSKAHFHLGDFPYKRGLHWRRY